MWDKAYQKNTPPPNGAGANLMFKVKKLPKIYKKVLF